MIVHQKDVTTDQKFQLTEKIYDFNHFINIPSIFISLSNYYIKE